MIIDSKSPEFRALLEDIFRYFESRPVKKWMNQDEVETIYGIKTTQLFELRRDGHVKSKKVGAKVLIQVESIDRYLNKTIYDI